METAHLLVGLILGFPEKADVFDESGFDVLVIHELTENVELLAEELIREVHLQRDTSGHQYDEMLLVT